MSMGRPIITTDAPGCRETVIDGVNGFLVPVRDSVILSQAMEKFLQNKELIADMGAKSREIAETRYDVNIVNQTILQAMGLDALVASQNQPSWDLASKSPTV
jgi:glycosyltransferase involved in cell wall biosynthesis